ncbi:hypothetical protein [Leptospira borgpetersenii]|uniref:hypothetical protein n=1 Tax=Leptospira borgpetersenii TaxID=174 RepID=UPI00034B1104|nr:hypothetical protein [Leptospira borgpetersenii]URD71596.1 hypothetical protein LIX26_16615 [Leptospira borgpetersenii]UVD74798.1 hypothetical protein NU962_16780 [Leptospira borgpetersenii]UVD77983.1 hypothetical protein LIX27_16850 [Leptospira borgpetersenii]UZW34552.1 hypothetical protein OR565_16855 [Leptospira borgpetersenii]
MSDSSLSTKVFLFRLNNWTIEKEHTLLEKFEAYGLNDYFQGYDVPGHPEIRGLYFVPATQELKTQVERLISEAVTLSMSAIGTYDLFDIPFSDIEKKQDSIPIVYIILGILIILLIIGAIK